MKNLIVIRHAKSDWGDPLLEDRDRPLNRRGLRDAPFMAGRLAHRGLRPDLVFSSPARRARETAAYMAEKAGVDPAAIELNEVIYMQGPQVLWELLRDLDDRWSCVYLVGHNPDLSRLVGELLGEGFVTLPTCSTVSRRVLSPGCGR